VSTATDTPATERAEVIEAFLPRFVGLHGFEGAGKDTVGKILTEYGYNRVAFADVLRKALYILNPLILSDSHGRDFRLKEIVDEIGWDEAKRSYPEIRRMLQVLATEVGRELISKNVWVDAAFKDLDPEKKYVFTDVRFENEHQAVDKNLGLLIKITRPGYGPVNDHKSTKELPDLWFDAHVKNDGTIGELHTKVHNILAQA
jgi:hypothetical protein